MTQLPREKIPILAMKIPRHLDKLSTGAGLLVLAIGFASLGFLSITNRHLEDAENGLFFDSTYTIVGSFLSILLGATFLAIAVLFTATLRRRNRSLETVKSEEYSGALPIETFVIGRP